MGEYVLPAAPNWYCSRVSDCSDDGLFLYGARQNVFVFNIAISPATYVGRFNCHTDRLVGLSEGGNRRAVTAGEDCRVRVWDYAALHDGGGVKLLDEHANHKNKPTVVHWSSKTDVIVSGDEKGAIVVWHMSRSDVRQMLHEKSSITCLECSPHNRFHIAVGYRSGLILIIDISSQGVVLQRLRGHDDEIHTVTWCPHLGEDVRQRTEDEEEKASTGNGHSSSGCLLASGSRDRTLRVWSSTKGRCLLNFKVTSTSGRREKYEDQKVRVWLAVRWMTDRPHHLVSSTQGGDLLCWDLCRPGKQKYDVIAPQGSQKGHHRIVFNICSPGGDLSHKLVTISMDRQVIIWDLETTSVEAIPTLGGFAYCLAQSLVNPARLAIGVGDNMIRVWNTEHPNNPYDCTTYWQGLKSKVTALSWHPEREGHLTFGTDDGRVGIYDVTSGSNRPPRMSSTFHKKTVYVITWGPPCHDDKDTTYVVYSCGDGKILIHNFNNPEEDAADLNSFLPNHQKHGPGSLRSEISWKQDFSAVAIGSDDGTIDVYKMPGFCHIATLQVHRKLINVIRWHPIFTGDAVTPSPCQHWMATGSNEPTIHVFNLDALMESPPTDGAPIISNSYISLEGHSHRITGLAWSNHSNGLLASASYDGSVQVWRVVPTVESVANFRGHEGRLLGVAWSPRDPDLVYSGGDDFCVLTWRVSAQEHKVPPQGTERKKKSKSKNRVKQTAPELETKRKQADIVEPPAEVGRKSCDVTMTEIQAMLEAKKRELMKGSGDDVQEGADQMEIRDTGQKEEDLDGDVKSVTSTTSLSVEDHDADQAPVKRELRDHKKRRVKSMFPIFSNAENRRKGALQEECVTLAKVLAEGSFDGNFGDGLRHLGMYSSRRDVYQLVDEEAANHKGQGNKEQLLYLDIWSGDLTSALERAAQKGQLNDLLMAHATSVSPVMWRGLCEKYAQQLECDGHVTKAAAYLVSAGHVHRALEMLQRHRMFKEAVSLARLRLSPHDSVITDLYTSWAEQLLSETAYEQAAKCYMAVGRHLEAAKCLARRYDLSALRAALDITYLANETESFKAYGQKYIHECQLNGEWMAAWELTKAHECFKRHQPLLLTHETLVRQLSHLNLYTGQEITSGTSALLVETPEESRNTKKLPKLLLDPDVKDNLCPWKPHLVEDEPVILNLLRHWLDLIDLHLQPKALRSLYKELSELRSNHSKHSQQKQILIEVSLDVTLGILCLLLANTKMAAFWWVGAMVTCQQTQNNQLMEGLCRILLPQGRSSLPLLQQQVVAVKTVMIGDIKGSDPTHISKPYLPDLPDITVTDSTDPLPPPISNSATKCSSMDCLSAFYCLAVTNFWIQTLSKGSPGEGQSTSEGTEATSETKDTVPGDRTVSLRNHLPTADERPNLEQVLGLCRGLLWEVQTKRNIMRALLAQIERTATEKIQNLKTQKDAMPEATDKDDDDVKEAGVPSDLLTCSNIPIFRTLSGEYLNMSSRVKDYTSPKMKLTTSPVHRPNRSGSLECEPLNEDEAMLHDADGGELASPFEEDQVEKGAPNNEADDILASIKETDEEKDVGVPVGGRKLSNIKIRFPDWSVGLLEDRYTRETSLTTLSEDKEMVTTELVGMSAYVTSTPFPEPSRSLEVILQLLDHLPEGVHLIEPLREWGKKHAYINKGKDVFKL